MNCVMTYHNPDGIKNNSGFRSFRDMLYSTALACIVAKDHFNQVIMYTTTNWYKLFRDLGIPFDGIDTRLDLLKFDKYFWAYSKLVTYSSQTESFIHIDNDVFMWDGLPKHCKGKRYIFQSKEPFVNPAYHYYKPLREIFDEAPIKPNIHRINEKKGWVYNCGICGGTDVDLFKEHIKLSREYVFAPENHYLFYHKYKDMLIHQNLMHEQYFLGSLIDKYKLHKKVGVLSNDVDGINTTNFRYTHLWGTSKKDGGVPEKVQRRLRQLNPELYYRIRDKKLEYYDQD